MPLAPSAPATWREGHRYIAQYAPRIDPLLPEGACALTMGLEQDEKVVLGEVTIRQRERRFAMPQQPQSALDVAVGGFARLVGVDVSHSALTPGETFEVTLYAQAMGTADRDYTAFVHVVGAGGRVWTQSDSWPEQGNAPTTSWVAGQVIVDTHTLVLPSDAPAGTYTVFVGLYDAERGPRVPLYDANGAPIPAGRAPVQMLVVSY